MRRRGTQCGIGSALLEETPGEFEELFEQYVKELSLYDEELANCEAKESVGDTDCASYLQELFLLSEFRGRGIARDIFCGFIERQKRDTGFCFVPESESGKYFIRLLKEAGYSYDLYQEDEVRQFCHVHVCR